MTSGDIALVVKSVSPIIREFYTAQIEGLKATFALEMKAQQMAFAELLAAMETRIAAAEERPMLAGPRGEPGERGPIGEMGPMGPVGPQGVKGDAGAIGPAGPMGPQGVKGETGIMGPAGDTGPRGDKGDAGINGRDGMPGVPGRTGEKGADGLDGKNGLPGLNGKDGANGKDGRDGKDGLGFDDFDIVLDEQKGFLAVWSNGKRRVEKELPLPFNAGLWQAGRTYPKSAYVEWKGSQFYALRRTNAQPDANGSQEWRLVAKRGRDGKDAV